MPRSGGDCLFAGRPPHPVAGFPLSWSQRLRLISFWIGFPAYFAPAFAAPATFGPFTVRKVPLDTSDTLPARRGPPEAAGGDGARGRTVRLFRFFLRSASPRAPDSVQVVRNGLTSR
jgi:hypothetical protein